MVKQAGKLHGCGVLGDPCVCLARNLGATPHPVYAPPRDGAFRTCSSVTC